MKRNLRGCGFSLMEVMVAVGIIILLAAAGLANYQNWRLRSNSANAVQTLTQFEGALKVYLRTEDMVWPEYTDPTGVDGRINKILNGSSSLFPGFDGLTAKSISDLTFQAVDGGMAQYYFDAGKTYSPADTSSGVTIQLSATNNSDLDDMFLYMNADIDGDDPTVNAGKLRRATDGTIVYTLGKYITDY